MVYIPFVYFILLLLFYWRKNKAWTVDVAAVSILVLVSFFAILIDVWDLYGESGVNEKSISAVGVVLFCVEWTVVLFPFHILARLPIRLIDEDKIKLFRFFVIFFMVFGVILIFVNLQDLKQAMVLDAVDVKTEHYEDLGSGYKDSGQNLLLYVANLLLVIPFSTLALVWWFYSISFMKNPLWLNWGLLFLSIVPIIMATLIAGRASITYWVVEFYFCSCFFWRYIANKQRFRIITISSGVAGLIVVFFVTITLSRFDDGIANGPLYSFTGYAGQSINNLSSFLEYGENSPFQIGRIFPLTNKILGQSFNLGDFYDNITHYIGIQVNRFSTFGGELFLDLGWLGLLVFLALWCVLINHSIKKQSEISFPGLIWISILFAFFTRGLFAWPFIGYYSTAGLLAAIFLYLLFHYRFKLKS